MRKNDMNKWFTRIGIILIVIALILVSPIMDLLPVDLWQWLSGLFWRLMGNEPKHYYFKIVPATETKSNIYIIVLIVTGIFFIALGKVIKLKSKVN